MVQLTLFGRTWGVRLRRHRKATEPLPPLPEVRTLDPLPQAFLDVLGLPREAD